MSSNNIKSFEQLLTSSEQLQQIIKKSELLQQLDHKVKNLITDQTLRTHCQVANLRDGVLVIATDNANWATRLRYLTGNLLAELRKQPEFAGIASIKCYVKS